MNHVLISPQQTELKIDFSGLNNDNNLDKSADLSGVIGSVDNDFEAKEEKACKNKVSK